MSNYKIEFFGWCHTEGHDKCWGWISIGEDRTLYNFWGARGKRYTFKKYQSPTQRWDRNILENLSREKMTPGRKTGTYERIDPAKVMEIVPNFEDEFEKQLALAKLFDNFHGEKSE